MLVLRRPFFLLSVAAVILFTFTFLAVETSYLHGTLVDDAYISLRNSRNFANGYGLVYNPGERVEAYTNFLLTVVMALPFRLHLDPIASAKALGWLAGATSIIATGAVVRRLAGLAPAGVVMAVMALDERFAWFADCGLETILVGACYMPALLLLQRRHVVGAALLFVAAVMTRMETGLLVGLACLFLLRRSGFKLHRLRVPLRFVATFVGVYGTYYAWRFAYYRWPFPNTYYAKVGRIRDSWERGAHYLDISFDKMAIKAALFSSLGAAALVGIGVLVAIAIGRRAPRRFFGWPGPRGGLGPLVLASTVLYAAYVVSVGGDHFGARFIYHFYPLLLASIAWVWSGALGLATRLLRLRPEWRSGVTAALVSVLLFRLATTKADVQPETGLNAWRAMGMQLHAHAPQGAVLATDAAGAMAFESDIRTVDILGLADEHIAHLPIPIGRGVAGHEKGDAGYVLFARRPDYISTWVDDDGHVARGFRVFWEFWKRYELVELARFDVRFDLSFERLIPINEELSPAALALWKAGRGDVTGYYPWGLWAHRKHSVPPRAFGRLDIPSDIPEATLHDDALVAAKAGHAPGRVMFPSMWFSPGHFEVSFDVAMASANPPAADHPVCIYSINNNEQSKIEHALVAGEWLDQEMRIIDEFIVDKDSTLHPWEFRLQCDGSADVKVTHGELRECGEQCLDDGTGAPASY